MQSHSFCIPLVEDACGSMEMMPTNSMQLLLYALIAYAIAHYVALEWMVMLVV